MEKEYSLSFGMKLLYGLIGTIIFVVGAFLLLKLALSIGSVIISLLFLSTGVAFIMNFNRRRVVFTSKSISCVTLLKTKTLDITSIKGYRLGQKVIKIEPLDSNEPTISIGNYSDFEDSDTLVDWFTTNCKDLDAADFETEHQQVLKDSTLGATVTEREGKIEQAKQIAVGYNISAVIASIIMVFVTSKVGVLLLLTIPLLGILLLFRFELLRVLSNSKRSVYSTIFLGMMLPGFVMTIMASDIHLFKVAPIWTPMLIVSCMMFALLCLKGINKAAPSVIGQVLFMLLGSLLYGYGSIRMVNSVFDDSKPYRYHAKVIDHSISHGKHTHYYLKLSRWGPQKEADDIDVSRTRYENTAVGDQVEILYKAGLLNIPWYRLAKAKE